MHCHRGYLLCLLSMIFLHHVRAQNILYIAPGTDLTISSGTNLSLDNFSLAPSSGFTMNGITLAKNTTISHAASGTYISRVYAFSGTTGSFSGNIQMGYQDGAELNGLPEAGLQLNLYNGVSWQAFAANMNNTVSNFVLTTSLSNVTLNELTLAASSSPLPLRWGVVGAYRRNNQVLIEWGTLQEYKLAYFNVEKSMDGSFWAAVIRDIPARNLDLPHQYQQTDPVYSPEKIFYRIRQVDIDGQYSYSAVVAVSAENSKNAFVLYPNPVKNSFYLSGDSRASLKRVQLITSGGVLLKTWESTQDSYPVDLLAAGVYYVRLTKTDGSTQYEILVKK